MGQRLIMGLVALVAVVAIGGIGFAAFTTSAYINQNAAAGTLGPLEWSNLGEPTGTNSWDYCAASITTTHNASDTLNFWAQNLAPGDSCTFTADLNNLGTIPANVYSTLGTLSGTACGDSYYLDNFGYAHEYTTNGPVTVPGLGYIAYTGTFTLGAGVGNSYQGQYCDGTFTLSATAGS